MQPLHLKRWWVWLGAGRGGGVGGVGGLGVCCGSDAAVATAVPSVFHVQNCPAALHHDVCGMIQHAPMC
jgi:hypothetical protein